MWIMILMTTYFEVGNSSRAMATPAITSVEFSSRERCITAASFALKQPKVYNAFCVQK